MTAETVRTAPLTDCPLTEPHPHGSADDHPSGCRCPDTLTAHRYKLAKNRLRFAQIRDGQYEPDRTVPIGPVLDHLNRLLRTHTIHGIARATGIHKDTLFSLRRSGRTVCRASTAQTLLDFQGDPAATVPVNEVPTLATTRRLRALNALGHPLSAVAALAPIPPGTKDPAKFRLTRQDALKEIRAGRRTGTSPTLEADTAAAYDQLWNQPPDHSTRAKRAASTQALRAARTNGWLPPMYLDDDRMGDPTYHPRKPYGPREPRED